MSHQNPVLGGGSTKIGINLEPLFYKEWIKTLGKYKIRRNCNEQYKLFVRLSIHLYPFFLKHIWMESVIHLKYHKSLKSSGVFEGHWKGISRKFQGCFKEVLRAFQGIFKSVSSKFQGCLRKFQGCFKKVFRKIEGCFNGVLSGCQACLNEVESVFEGSFQSVSRMFLGHFKDVLR